MRSRSFLPWFAGLLCVSACAPTSAPEAWTPPSPAVLRSALEAENGKDLNGKDLNGKDLNGTDLSKFMVSVNYNTTRSRWGEEFEDVWLQGTSFYGYRNGHIYRDTDFVGAELRGNLGGGGTVRVRIKTMSPAPAPNADINLYGVEFLNESGVWRPACQDTEGNALQAMPVQGVWNYNQGTTGGGSKQGDPSRFTFACMGGAIAKCALWGYRPWASYNGYPLEQYHQACTRLVRADYCGDGSTYTVTGNRINFYDDIGLQTDAAEWVFEAEWDVSGAKCFYALNRSHSKLPCFNARVDALCGQQVGTHDGGLLFNETPGTLGVDPGL